MSRLLEIASGWYNMIRATPELQEMAKERLTICDSCPAREELTGATADVISIATRTQTGAVLYRCGKCGCPLSAKTLSPASHCPLGKW